jgi:Kef-type K+ transport system membrane component KefB
MILEHYSPNLLTIIGAVIIVAFLGSKIFQRFGSPQVVGFIVMGVLLGSSFLNVIDPEMIEKLSYINHIALGLIGFDMGSHLRLHELSKLRRSLLFILLFEAIGTFLLVTAGIYAITHSLHTSLIFGALASATAPAATVDVLAEFDAKGPLTTSILAVVGLDDAIALLLYSISAAFAETLLSGTESFTIIEIFKVPVFEIIGSIGVGVILGYFLDIILCRMKNHHDAMAISIAVVLVAVGVSQVFGFSLILSTMILGTIIVNRCEEHGKFIRYTIEQAGPVIYVLFFALVGARFQISLLPSMGLLGIAYILLRSFGKFTGAWLGGKLGNADPAVTKNLGFGLLSQAGVAIGLAIDASNRFSLYGDTGAALGRLVISVITATTFIVQIIGPIFVKFAITRAGEIGKAKMTDDVWASEGSPQ